MKTFITILIVIVLGAGIYLVFRGRGDQEASPSTTPTATATVSASAMPTASASPTVSATVSASASPKASASPSATPKTVSVVFNGDAFEVSTVTIKKGDTVTWKNASGGDMWVASAVHPTHDAYQEHVTCFSGVFTNCKVAAGGTFTMKFNAVGTWPYHDHLNPQLTGTVIVTQ